MEQIYDKRQDLSHYIPQKGPENTPFTNTIKNVIKAGTQNSVTLLRQARDYKPRSSHIRLINILEDDEVFK